jgi:hypothetical protein
LKREVKVYTKIIPDASSETLYPIIERKVVPDSIVYSDLLARLQCAGCIRLQALSHQSVKTLRRQAEPHEWHRELLEPGKASFAEIQWCSKGVYWVIFDEMRVALQKSEATRSITTVETMGNQFQS